MLTKKELLYIEETLSSYYGFATTHRRNLHQIPEVAWTEHKTTAYLETELSGMGYSITKGEPVTGYPTGLIAELEHSGSPLLAMRFDIDALAVTEDTTASHLPNRFSFPSLHDGNMHACGHDGHMAIGLTVAKFLAENSDKFRGKIRLIFQPAEEGCRGARTIVDRGWLKDVDYFFAGHIVGREYGQTPDGPADCVTGVTGSLATSKINASFKGHPCHGACPENGASAISALSNAVLALNAIPRNSGGSTMVNIGRIMGGEGRNIVAANAYMELEVRGETTELNQYMEDQALARIETAASLYGCSSEVFIQGKAPSLVSSEDLHQQLNSLLGQLETVLISKRGERFKASEDASLMMEEVKRQGGKAAFMLFPTDTTAPLHSRNYDFDESILIKAATVFCVAACNLMK